MFADRLGLSAWSVYLLFGAWGGFAWSLINAAWFLYYVTVAHLDPLQLVLVGTALEASYFVWEIPTGVLADTFSRRMSVILGTGIIYTAWIGQGLVPVFVAIAAFEIVRGLGEAFTHGAIEAWVAGECGDDGLDALFLRETQLTQIAGFVGLPVGVALATIDLRIPIVFGGSLGLALAVLLVFVMPERHHPRRNEAKTWRATVGTARRGLWAVRSSTLLVALLAAEFFWGAASEGWDRMSDAHLLLDLNFPPFGITPVVAFGVMSLVGTILIIITAQIVRRVVRHLDERVVSRWLVAMQLVRIACQAVFALAPWSALAIAVGFLNSMLRASFYPLFNAWLIRRTDEDVRATVLSTTSVASAIGQVGGGPISGAIGNAYGIPLGLLSSVAMLVPGTLFLARAVGLRARGDRTRHGRGAGDDRVSHDRMTKVTRTLYVHRVADWRAWLRKHDKTSREIWLVYYRKETGKPRISYNDAVDEALCFGWIDSTQKKIDADRTAQRFTPRRPGSPTSEMNKARARRLVREKRMTRAGLAAIGTLRAPRLAVPADIKAALERDPSAWKHFQSFPAAYRRIRLAFVEGARDRPAEFRRRLGNLVRKSARNERFGMVRE